MGANADDILRQLSIVGFHVLDEESGGCELMITEIEKPCENIPRRSRADSSFQDRPGKHEIASVMESIIRRSVIVSYSS